jgi:AraC family transcriptional activator of pobA
MATHIPIHKLTDRASLGIEIKHSGGDTQLSRKLGSMTAHRDDYYIFFVIEQGTCNMMIDFTEVTIKAGSVYYILPGQVHYGVSATDPQGWFIAVDTSLVQQEFRLVFENQLLLQQPYMLNNVHFDECIALIGLLQQHLVHNTSSAFYIDILRSLLNSFIGKTACGYVSMNERIQKQARPTQIAHSFKQLLATHFKTEKRPLAYASMLNISESYLNEALKKVTGFSVSYWITHEVMLEARRLLYYSELNAKQIAHELGYDDHTYFSRLFKNNTGNTPLTFRSTYRK